MTRCRFYVVKGQGHSLSKVTEILPPVNIFYRLKPNFMWSLSGSEERKFDHGSLKHDSR